MIKFSPSPSGKSTPKEETMPYVILSMSSEQTCLQGFVSDDIHKAQAFCKNAKNESFNAVALCALY